MTGGISYTYGGSPVYTGDLRFDTDGLTITPLNADALLDTMRLLTKKSYELTNHLGNVISGVGDKKLGINTISPAGGALAQAECYTPDVISSGKYYD
jgi:hypothetical protein